MQSLIFSYLNGTETHISRQNTFLNVRREILLLQHLIVTKWRLRDKSLFLGNICNSSLLTANKKGMLREYTHAISNQKKSHQSFKQTYYTTLSDCKYVISIIVPWLSNNLFYSHYVNQISQITKISLRSCLRSTTHKRTTNLEDPIWKQCSQQ